MAEPTPSDWLTASEIGDLYQVDPKAPRWAVEEFMRYARVPLRARRGWSEAGFVCFIQAESGGPIKISGGVDPKRLLPRCMASATHYIARTYIHRTWTERKLRDAQRSQSERLVLLAVLPGQGRKRELVDQFIRWRVPGTTFWFAADAPGLADLIASARA